MQSSRVLLRVTLSPDEDWEEEEQEEEDRGAELWRGRGRVPLLAAQNPLSHRHERLLAKHKGGPRPGGR